jgi:hypothetical protein
MLVNFVGQHIAGRHRDLFRRPGGRLAGRVSCSNSKLL